MAAEIEELVVAAADNGTATDEVKPYRTHVSSRYLNLTRQKLEIARLPHEIEEPKSKDWWQPKSKVEPLIDFWLEQYQWREEEERLNRLPQFRTSFAVSGSESPVRIHFIHARSTRSANTVPLLLIPPFPFTCLSLGHLIELFTDPAEVNHQPFHLVIPSLPGLGFSDTLPTNSPVVSVAAGLFDSLMKRLGYSFYLATNAGAGASSPAQIDYRVANELAVQYPDSCLGAHLISPPLTRPKPREEPLGWAKWTIASALKASIFGYQAEDFSALKQQKQRQGPLLKRSLLTEAGFMPGGLGLTEPNTLAYALCDSPTGLLVFVMGSLRFLAPAKEFTPTEVINFTQLAWLPGPESAMRFWAYCSRHPEEQKKKRENQESGGDRGRDRPTGKRRVALTVFLGGDEQVSRGEGGGGSHPGDAVAETGDTRSGDRGALGGTRDISYVCPGWARTRYNVLHTNRVGGKPGLLAWERPEVIAAGVRGLAAAILKIDKRLEPSKGASPSEPEPVSATATAATAPAVATTPVDQQQQHSSNPKPPEAPQPGLLAPPKTLAERLPPVREISDDTKVASDDGGASSKAPTSGPATPSPLSSTGPPPFVTVETK